MTDLEQAAAALARTETDITQTKREIKRLGDDAPQELHGRLVRLRIEAMAYRKLLNRETTS